MIQKFMNAILKKSDKEETINCQSMDESIVNEPHASPSETLQQSSQLYRLDDRIKNRLLHYFQQHVKFASIRAIDEDRFKLLVAKNRELLGSILKLPVTVGATPEDERQAVGHATDHNEQPATDHRKYFELQEKLKEDLIRCLTKNYQFLMDHQALDYDFKTRLIWANNKCINDLMELPVKKSDDLDAGAVPNRLKIKRKLKKLDLVKMKNQLQGSSEAELMFKLANLSDFFNSGGKMACQPFYCLNAKWIIVASAKVQAPKQLELFLELQSPDFQQQSVARNVSASFEILHPKSSQTDLACFLNHTFTSPGEYCGGSVALYDYLVKQKFVRNDICLIKFNMSITKLFFHSLPFDFSP